MQEALFYMLYKAKTRKDLKEDSVRKLWDEITFEDFTDEVQNIIARLGRAIFKAPGLKVIRAPKEQKTKTWRSIDIFGGMKGSALRNKAHKRALAFIQENNFQPGETMISEGAVTHPAEDGIGLYAVTVYYFHHCELFYEKNID